MEIRDPVHVFVHLADAEQTLIDCSPFQRLRDIHQLSLTHFVYPGASHCRLEHSLGVMELATRIFDVVTNLRNIRHDEVRSIVPEDPDELGYWRRVLRAASLCHDLGHLPFSHAAESLLPDGWDHERLSAAYIESDQMESVWSSMTPPLRSEDVALLAVGPEHGEAFKPWQAILSEMITGDVFGADRMDYLLRDSHHVGVAYGRFDHYRLIETLRLLPAPPVGDEESTAGEQDQSRDPTLGVTTGGVNSAEALLLARYSMFSQVYFHRTRRIYDKHLGDFLRAWLPKGKFPIDLSKHLRLTDSTVTAAIQTASRYSGNAQDKIRLRLLSRRLIDRDKRFAPVFEPSPADLQINVDAAAQVADALCERYGADCVLRDSGVQGSKQFDFPVLHRSGDIASSLGTSEILRNVPPARFDWVYVDPIHRSDAESWLKSNKEDLIAPQGAEDD